MDFSGIPSSVASKDLENFILRLFQKIGVDLDELRIVACHRLGKTDRTIVNFLNREDAENVYSKKRKLKDVDISCLFSDDIQNRNDINRGSQNDWSDGGLSRKRKVFIIKESLPVMQIFVWFSQSEEGTGSDFLFPVFQRNHPYEGVTGFTCN